MKKVLSLILISALLVAMFAGCGGTEASTEVSSAAAVEESVAAAPEEAPAEEPAEEAEEVSLPEEPAEEVVDPLKVDFPVEEDITITMFTSVNTAITPYIDSDHYDQISVLRGWTEYTGVKLDVTAVSSEIAKEQFALLAAAKSILKTRAKGGCSGCSGCSGNCSGCPHSCPK